MRSASARSAATSVKRSCGCVRTWSSSSRSCASPSPRGESSTSSPRRWSAKSTRSVPRQTTLTWRTQSSKSRPRSNGCARCCRTSSDVRHGSATVPLSQSGRQPDQDRRIVVLSGPSGSGKSTIVNRLIELAPVHLIKAISATTRPRRAAEKDGVDYYFLSAAEFEAKRQAGDFLEYAEVFGSGYWYGTLKTEVER